jgi:hypothetical protein
MAALSQTAASVVSGTSPKKQTGIAGGTITAGMPVYKDTAASNVLKAARANAAATAVVAGIALNSASSGQPLVYQIGGKINLGATMVVGETYCLSDAVAGQIVPLSDLGSGDYTGIIGTADSASILTLAIHNSGVAKA